MVKTSVVSRQLILIMVIAAALVYFSAQNVSAVDETGRTEYKLMDGVTESTIYAVGSGKSNLTIHMLRVQQGANVSVKAGYKNYYYKNSTQKSRLKRKWTKKMWKWSTVPTHVKEYESSKDRAGKVIAAASMDFLGSGGRPMGKLMVEGRTLCNSNVEEVFAVLKSGQYSIRTGSSITSDVSEAVGGGSSHITPQMRLVSSGKIKVKKGSAKEPRQAIGYTANQDLVIVNVDGRDPTSVGATTYDLAMIMKQQGCVEAINMDGGGSAAFYTKRSSDKSIQHRNIAGDGLIRNIASSIMIVKNTKASTEKVTGQATVSMKNDNTGLVKSKSGLYSYIIGGKKQTGLHMINGHAYLFNDKGNGITKTFKLGKHKYKFKKGRLTSCSDKKAGVVKMGYCGAASGGKNIIYAVHSKDRVMNLGINPLVKKNGKMKNWKSNPVNLPWYADRAKIKTINFGSGMVNVGNYFMYVSTNKIFDGSKMPKGALTKISFPNTMKTIGSYAFFNKPNVKNVVFPASVRTIGTKAFAYSGKGYMKFNTKKPPTIKGKAFISTKCSKFIVKNTKAWKKYVKAKKLKKRGFKKTVKYVR